MVGTGPGSFIGTRVALSYANGLAATGFVPLYGVNSLAAIAAVHGSGRSVVLRDARRGQAYWYGPAGPEPTCRLAGLDELARELAAAGIESVIVEEVPPEAKGYLKPSTWLRAAVAQAGARLITCPGVPAEGLRRMQASARPQEYAEPVYLRGWE